MDCQLAREEIFVVPRGTEHKPPSPGDSILMFEPSGCITSTAMSIL